MAVYRDVLFVILLGEATCVSVLWTLFVGPLLFLHLFERNYHVKADEH